MAFMYFHDIKDKTNFNSVLIKMLTNVVLNKY